MRHPLRPDRGSWTEGGGFENFVRAGRGSAVARFKGTDSTFSSFPKRLEHVLSKSIDNVVTECIVFPEYEVFPHDGFSLLELTDIGS